MIIVRAKAAGIWGKCPQNPPRDWEKTLVRVARVQEANETWAVNHRPVKVFPGLILGFLEKENADFFLQTRRAEQNIVETGMELIFESNDDARHFVTHGMAEALTPPMTYEEVMEMFAKMQAEAEAELAAAAGNEEQAALPAPPKKARAKAKAKAA